MLRRFLPATALLLVLTALAAGADECPAPPSRFSNDPNIFSPEQEMYLGEAIATQRQRSYEVIDDKELNAYLQAAGDRLLQHLPDNHLQYHFVVNDVPVLNAWGVAGGHIYVTRKMVAFLQSDAELEALLAHEIGHVYTHQQATSYTRWFDQYLGVKQLGDREDVFRRYNELLDNWRRKRPKEGWGPADKGQLVADQVGLYILARAGYPPEAMPDFFDRLAETHGKTGNFFSDLFGFTNDENRRLREMLKTVKILPRHCVDEPPASSLEGFRKWQAGVIAYAGHPEAPAAPSVAMRKAVLEPPLQTDFRQVRFSPDGTHLLVQDDSGISVLSRQPFAFLFRIPATDAHLATFSPDSRYVVFYSEGLRVEKWDVAARKQAAAHELLVRVPCVESALSSDGATFACYDWKNALHVRDVDSGTDLYSKDKFSTPNWFRLFQLFFANHVELDVPFHFLTLMFSPDSHVLVAAAQDASLALDLRTKQNLPFSSSLAHRMAGQAAFLDNDSVAVVDYHDSGSYRFPTGQLIRKLDLRWQEMSPATQGPYLMLRPVDKLPVGVLDVQQNKLVFGNRKTAVDAYGDLFASEARDGQVVLSRLSGPVPTPVDSLTLPLAQVSTLRAVSASEDLGWLAYSIGDRGAIFDLKTGQRTMLTRGFRGVAFEGDTAYAQFAKFENVPRSIGALDMVAHESRVLRQLDDEVYVRQAGPFLLLKRPSKPGGSVMKNVTLEVQNVADGHVLWSRKLDGKTPGIFPETGARLLVLASGISEAKEEDQKKYELPIQFEFPSESDSVYDLELLDLATGQHLGSLRVDSGKQSFAIKSISASRDYLALADSMNRVLLYSVATGHAIGNVFGGPALLIPGGRMLVVTGNGTVTLFDCATLAKQDEFHFPAEPVFAQSTPNGRRVLVLTADQTAFVLDLAPKPAAPPSAAVH
ncbi:MAG TPA: M48 family metalloprotease [Terriglobales bacterium]|nr:M48 family metalloprotease [Terriglobales bacterium]